MRGREPHGAPCPLNKESVGKKPTPSERLALSTQGGKALLLVRLNFGLCRPAGLQAMIWVRKSLNGQQAMQ